MGIVKGTYKPKEANVKALKRYIAELNKQNKVKDGDN